MEQKLPLTEDTPLREIMDAYPWLKDEAVRMDERFKALDNPLVKLLIKKATIADASRRTGFKAQDIISEIEKMVENHRA